MSVSNKYIRIISDFGIDRVAGRTSTDFQEIDIKDKETRALLSRIEDYIRKVYTRYGRRLKTIYTSTAPVYTGTYRKSFSFRTFPTKRRNPVTDIDLEFGFNRGASNFAENAPYYYRILKGDSQPHYAPRNVKITQWALKKGLIYYDGSDYRWKKYSKKDRSVRIKGNIFSGMMTFFDSQLDMVWSQQKNLFYEMEDELVEGINEILVQSGLF